MERTGAAAPAQRKHGNDLLETMTIGEKIIRKIILAEMFKIVDNTTNSWAGDTTAIWRDDAAEQLDALVAAHVEEQVRIRLERAVLWLVDEGYKKDVVLAELSKPTTEHPAD